MKREYEQTTQTETAHLAGFGRLVFDPTLPSPNGNPQHLFLELADHLGSTTSVLDAATGEVVEATTYQAQGALESDYRPERWQGFREDYKFTGKEEDVELGIIYFGARYFHPRLGRWMSPDPLTVHGIVPDSNAYSYVNGDILSSIDPLGIEEGRGCIGDDEICGPRGARNTQTNDPPTGDKTANAADTRSQMPQWLVDYMVSGTWEDPQVVPPSEARPTPFQPYAAADPVSRWLNTGEDVFARYFRGKSFNTYLQYQQVAAGTAAAAATLYLGSRAFNAAAMSAGPTVIGALLRIEAIVADVNAGLTTGGVSVGTGMGVDVLVSTPGVSAVAKAGASASSRLLVWPSFTLYCRGPRRSEE